MKFFFGFLVATLVVCIQAQTAVWVQADFNVVTGNSGQVLAYVGQDVTQQIFPATNPLNTWFVRPDRPKTAFTYFSVQFNGANSLSYYGVSVPDTTEELSLADFTLGWAALVPASAGYWMAPSDAFPTGTGCTTSGINNMTIRISDSRGNMNASTAVGITDLAINGNPASVTAADPTNTGCPNLGQDAAYPNDACATADFTQSTVNTQLFILDDPTPLQSSFTLTGYYAHTCVEPDQPAPPTSFNCNAAGRTIDMLINIGCGAI